MAALGLVAQKPAEPVRLTDVFHLPPGRPRSLKRIPQVVHYPPVIAKLFRDRFDEISKELTNNLFTFDDVRKAIRDTGVTLTWVRGDTFLAEISRSRNVRKLLEPSLRQGFTIRKLSDGDYIGQFVPVGHPEGLEVKLPPKRSVSSGTRKKGAARGPETLF